MKIEIEFESSYEAKVRIDGKEGRIFGIGHVWQTETPEISGSDVDTLGELIFQRLLSVVPGILQGWAAADGEQPNVRMWEVLTDEARDAAADRMEGF